MTLDDYKVTLDTFEGPLDLLLFLIRRDEIDIHDIPIASITNGYLAFLESSGGVDAIDVDLAAEFLVMAATLMEIKSRMISPLDQPEDGDEPAQTDRAAAAKRQVDPRSELVTQLLAYKRFRDAARALEVRHESWSHRYGNAAAGWTAAPIDPEELVEINDLTVIDLCDAFAHIMEAVDFSKLGAHTVADDETPIQVHAADLMDLLRRSMTEGASADAPAASLEFASIFKSRSRSECIGLFLAMLELIRQRQIVVMQDAIDTPITIKLRDADHDTAERAMADLPDTDSRRKRKK